jgi:hypothetical protein
VGEYARVGEGVAEGETVDEGIGAASLWSGSGGVAVAGGVLVDLPSRKGNDGKQPARRIRISVPHRPLRMDDPSGFRVGTLGGSALVVVPPGWVNYTLASPERSRALRKRTRQRRLAAGHRCEENGKR